MQFILMSAEKEARTPAQDRDNAHRTNILHDALRNYGLAYTPARGCYDGVEERSVLIAVEDPEKDAEFIRHLAFSKFEQESILIVDGESMRATLVYSAADRDPEFIGVFTKVPVEKARKQSAWTRVTARHDSKSKADRFDYYIAVMS